MSCQKGELKSSHPNDNLWDVFEYEVQMYFKTREILGNAERDSIHSDIIANALTESALLHTRILVDIILERNKNNEDDILLSELLPNWKSSNNLVEVIAELKEVYGRRKNIGSPYWVLNKMLAHPSSLRKRKYDYSELLKVFDPILMRAIREISILANRSTLKDQLPLSGKSSEEGQTSAYTHSVQTTIITKKLNARK